MSPTNSTMQVPSQSAVWLWRWQPAQAVIAVLCFLGAGIAQMNLGIILSLTNQRFFRDSLSTLCQFISQMIFLNSFFGYLSILIIAKWVNGSTADLYHIMIYMFLSPGNVDCSGGCPENVMYTGQGPILVSLTARLAT